MLPERDLKVALQGIAGVAAHGPFSRCVALQYLFPKPVPAPSVPPRPLWGMGSKLYGGRYTPKNSFETIYLAEDMVTALTEVVAIVTGLSGRAITLASGPWVIVAVHGVLLSILDLTIAANVQTIGSNYQELTGSWRYAVGQQGEPATHVLGRLCHQSKRFDGIRFPSSKNSPLGVCLAVFPDRLKSPAYLEVFDPKNNVPQRIS